MRLCKTGGKIMARRYISTCKETIVPVPVLLPTNSHEPAFDGDRNTDVTFWATAH
jgi:hypothetical protein